MNEPPRSLKKRSRRSSVMPVAKNAQKSREERLFGFQPIAFVDDVVNAANDYAYDGVDYVEKKLSAPDTLRLLNSAAASEEIGSGCDALLAEMQRVLDTEFEIFEQYVLQSVFQVPENLDLSGCNDAADDASDADDADEDSYDNEDETLFQAEQELDGELDQLMLQEAQLCEANRFMRESIAQLSDETAQITSLMEHCRALTANDTKPVNVTISTAIERLDMIRKMVETAPVLQADSAKSSSQMQLDTKATTEELQKLLNK